MFSFNTHDSDDNMKDRTWLVNFILIVLICLIGIGALVIHVDPYFHYHAPNKNYFYELVSYKERNVNDGITRHFDYDSIITGTSMTENFKTTEAEAIYGGKFIKLPYAGGYYNEINMNLEKAFELHPELKTVIRGLDSGYMMVGDGDKRTDMGKYPEYLYDNNIFNDVKYIFNKDVIKNCISGQILGKLKGQEPGITSFDEYANWMYLYEGKFTREEVLKDYVIPVKPEETYSLTEEEADIVRTNIRKNVTKLAKENPDAEFYYFFTPYSVAWWGTLYGNGELHKHLQMERIVIEEVLECENIHFYSFSNFPEIVQNICNYKDIHHYGEDVNTLLLQYMKEGKGLLTKDNYEDYLSEVENMYETYDYTLLTIEDTI